MLHVLQIPQVNTLNKSSFIMTSCTYKYLHIKIYYTYMLYYVFYFLKISLKYMYTNVLFLLKMSAGTT